MDIRYRNDLYGNYMLISIPHREDSNRYPFKMLEKNTIPGVLSAKERKEDGNGYWYVDISKKKSLLQEYQEKQLQLEDMLDIFQQLVPILEELRNYLLSESMVVWDPQYIFRNLEDRKLYVLLLPWSFEEKTLHKLAEFFLEKVNQRDENGVNAAYLFYKQQSQSHFSLYHFLPVLEKESILKRQKEKEPKNNCLSENKWKESFSKEGDEKKEEPYLFDDSKTIKLGKDVDAYKSKNSAIIVLLISIIFLVPGFLPVIRSTIRMSCIAFSILLFAVFLILFLKKGKIKEYSEKTEEKEVNTIPKIDIGTAETIFFDSFENEECLKLQWKERGRNKQFILKDLPCTVGKMKEETNLCISDISISRIHCRFVEQENRICIMDLNSTNGTFLNGLPVKNGEVLEIEKNDEILIGKVKVNVV